MSKPKIFVLHIRQIVKATAILAVGIIMLVSLIYFFARSDQGSTAMAEYPYSMFVPGTYRAKIYLSYRPVFLEVTVTEDEIIGISLEPLTQNQEMFYPLLRPTVENVTREILYSQNLDVASNYENAVTSQVVVSAVYRALGEARPNG